jgi:hypothetical protein
MYRVTEDKGSPRSPSRSEVGRRNAEAACPRYWGGPAGCAAPPGTVGTVGTVDALGTVWVGGRHFGGDDREAVHVEQGYCHITVPRVELLLELDAVGTKLRHLQDRSAEPQRGPHDDDPPLASVAPSPFSPVGFASLTALMTR